MIRALPLATALVCLCGRPDELRVSGPLPDGAVEVIEAAKLKCERGLVGAVTFTEDEGIVCGWHEPSHVNGCAGEKHCAADLVVRYFPDEGQTALREELGHYCLETLDDRAAAAWGNSL